MGVAMMDLIDSVMDEIASLRDADSHVCAYEASQQEGAPCQDSPPVCSCHRYDHVIDDLQMLKGMIALTDV